MTFKKHLIKLRIGYACRLLRDNEKSISQISFDSGFENLSNFNRLFKKVKGMAPSDFKIQSLTGEKYSTFYEPLLLNNLYPNRILYLYNSKTLILSI